MRFALSTTAVAFVLLIPFGHAEIPALPTAADGLRENVSAPPQDGDADNAKRIAEIQKEIAELQARIAKLTAELARLQPAGKPDTSKWVKLTGTITELTGTQEQPNGFY